MDKPNPTQFIPREVDADPLRIFEMRVSEVLPSIIAFAYGTRKDGAPNAIGSGFSVANIGKDDAGLYATCLHVMEEIAKIRDMTPTQLHEHELIDKKRRVAFLAAGKYEWHETGPIKFSDKIQNAKGNFVQQHDVCICHIPKTKLKPLDLSPNEYFIGAELGIVGFPSFERLQRVSVQPYVLRTTLSSHMMYPFERSVTGALISSERIALACIVGGGFSGSPVIYIRDGKVIGMVDYMPTEVEFADIKITKPNLLEENIRVGYPAGISFAVPSKIIQECLNYCLKVDWNNPAEQTYSRSS